MRYTVNDSCICCGTCTSLCPWVFSLGDSGFAEAIREDAPAEFESYASEAMQSCPAGAIEIVE